MSSYPQAILLDTNVWLENYIGERAAATQSQQLVDYCLEHEIALLVSASSLKDVYYNIGRYLKAKARAEGDEVTESLAGAMEHIAWSDVRNLMENATLVPLDTADFFEARRFYEVHRDFEDDLVLAAAVRAGADYLVTSDKKLLAHAPVATLTPADMLTLLESFG